MLDANFLAEFKRVTEARWMTHSIDPSAYGFQFQPGTRWNPGLSDEKIAEYEDFLGVRFPHDFTAFLRAMNGTDLPTLNVYGYCGEPLRQSEGVYSYPTDVDAIQSRIEDVLEHRAEVSADLTRQGFILPADAKLVPIFQHRYLVCNPDLTSSVVLSIVVNAVDAIVYADSLREYLEEDFLGAPGKS